LNCGQQSDHRGPQRAKRKSRRRCVTSDAWEEALHDGIEPEMPANATLFAALADLIGVYGEDAVAKMTTGLSRRIHHGEFTLKRTSQ
jgi:hypothetical protein